MARKRRRPPLAPDDPRRRGIANLKPRRRGDPPLNPKGLNGHDYLNTIKAFFHDKMPDPRWKPSKDHPKAKAPNVERLQLVLAAWFKNAALGDQSAIDSLFNRLGATEKHAIEVSGPGGQPLDSRPKVLLWLPDNGTRISAEEEAAERMDGEGKLDTPVGREPGADPDEALGAPLPGEDDE